MLDVVNTEESLADCTVVQTGPFFYLTKVAIKNFVATNTSVPRPPCLLVINFSQ